MKGRHWSIRDYFYKENSMNENYLLFRFSIIGVSFYHYYFFNYNWQFITIYIQILKIFFKHSEE